MANFKIENKLIMDVELLIFDKDGTLIDLYKYWSNMIRFRAEHLCRVLNLTKADTIVLQEEMGIDLEYKMIKSKGPVGVKTREIVMQAAINYLATIGHNETERLCFDVFKNVDKYSLEHLDQIISPIKGLYPLFNSLKKNSIKIAIATTDITQRAQLAVDQLKLTDQVDLIVGADMVSRTKPDPEMVKLILQKLNVKREKAVMVGDTMADIDLGINAGLKASIGVLTGLSERNELRQKTDYVVQSIADLSL